MANVPALASLPGVRGAFDEERCRWFLHQMGEMIVPTNNFDQGVREIYWQLLYEYGRSQIADAISVFHELIEDESHEGDVWRSWRLGWRQRNDDILNPFVPAVGDFILPPPTDRRIRALRGANFFASPVRRSGPSHEEHRPSFVSCHSDRHASGGDHAVHAGAVFENDALREAEQQSFDSSATDPASSAQHQATIDDDARLFLSDRAYNDEVPRMSLSAVKSHTVEENPPSVNTVSDHGSLRSSEVHPVAFNTDRHANTVIERGVLSVLPRGRVARTPGRFPIDSPHEDEISQIRPHKCKPNDHGEGVTCSRVSYERYPIDGHDEAPTKSGRFSAFLHRKGTLPNQVISRGRSLLQRLPKIFRKNRSSKQTRQGGQNATQDAAPFTGGLLRRRSSRAGRFSSTEDYSPAEFGPNRTTSAYTFDGACDEDDTSSTMTTVDLNKALPPQPIELKHKATVSSRAGTPSLTVSHGSNPRPSTASTGSSNLSRGSPKKRSHRTAHQLVHPNMAESGDASRLHQLDSDRFLVAPKHDPLVSPKLPDTPMTFSSFNNANPFMDQYEEFIPPIPMPLTPELSSPDPMKVPRYHGIPQSRSEGQIYSPKPLQIKASKSRRHLAQSDGPDEHAASQSRGRVPSRDIPQAEGTVQDGHEKAIVSRNESRKRSRSPVKRFLGLGKSQSMKEIPQEKESNNEIDKKAGLKMWGDRLRHGFLTNTESKPNTSASLPDYSKSRTPPRSTFPISIRPDRQAKIYCELELMICTTANTFLRTQCKAGLMSAESVSKVTTQWSHKNRPQVVEFQFDQATQRDLVLYNINTIRFHGEARTNPMILNSTMYAWKVMAKEMSVRTFCTPDSVIRKHMHDAHKVLELLGAGLSTFLSLQDLQVEALKDIAEAQKRRIEREKKQRDVGKESGNETAGGKLRKYTPPTPTTSFVSAPMSAFMDEETLFEDPHEG